MTKNRLLYAHIKIIRRVRWCPFCLWKHWLNNNNWHVYLCKKSRCQLRGSCTQIGHKTNHIKAGRKACSPSHWHSTQNQEETSSSQLLPGKRKRKLDLVSNILSIQGVYLGFGFCLPILQCWWDPAYSRCPGAADNKRAHGPPAVTEDMWYHGQADAAQWPLLWGKKAEWSMCPKFQLLEKLAPSHVSQSMVRVQHVPDARELML